MIFFENLNIVNRSRSLDKIDCKHDRESVYIMNLLSLLLRINRKANRTAWVSAEKILLQDGSFKYDLSDMVTAAQAVPLIDLDPSI